ncbi:uncharacterized protein FOMMEDRAFT_52477, partial [Fomitiporia mediterranea MF3/22]|uniref:uncharacterized protein n=1 Tax=Fomitiporia mediterranea (strain MF3/22) TaxID=694068 RepID=UPI0004408BC2
RYYHTPTFGIDTIWQFSRNMSIMKKIVARDFEDILQCVILAFKDLLLKKYNKVVLNLLFILVTWHALAKLYIHTETTVWFLEEITTLLGYQVQYFKKTVCLAYNTHKLSKEIATQGHCQAALLNKGKVKGLDTKTIRYSVKTKTLNINILKFYSLSVYASVICQFSMTDLYSTQIVK